MRMNGCFDKSACFPSMKLKDPMPTRGEQRLLLGYWDTNMNQSRYRLHRIAQGFAEAGFRLRLMRFPEGRSLWLAPDL
jgi:hypothetical protein